MDFMSNECIAYYSIPIQKSCGTLRGIFGGVANMVTFTSTNKIKDGNTHTPEQPVMIQHLKKSSWMYGRFQRKLVNESLGTFVSLQHSVDDQKDSSSALLKKSREYRSMIQACISEMNEYLETYAKDQSVPISDDMDEVKFDCQLLYKMELILGLVEIIFLRPQCDQFTLDHLVSWVRLHFPQCQQTLSECLSMDDPHLHPQYWNTCYGLLMQGFISEVRGLLSQHPDHANDEFLSIDELLRKMPIQQSFAGASQSDFKVRWLHWKNECEGRLQKQEFSACPELEKICGILAGKNEVFTQMMGVTDTWYHMMVSYLLYTNPTVMAHRLPLAAQQIISLFNIEIHDGSLDELLLHILENQHHQVLKSCHFILNNFWFTSHLADMLYHSYREQDEQKHLKHLRESLLLDYSLELAGHLSLWQVAVKYLDSCEEGRLTSEMILERVPLTSNSKALKVIEVAKERNMVDVVNGVCRVMSRQCLQNDQLGAAICWSVRSQDSVLTAHLANKILTHYMQVGRFQSESLLDTLGPAMLLSDTLTFLGKYREFHSIYQEGDLKAAGDLLVSLITSKMAPKYFWPVLLEDALPLLEMTEPVISSQQTFDLLYCLHDFKFDEEMPGEDVGLKEVKCEEREKEIRLALTSNLSRAIIQEGTKII